MYIINEIQASIIHISGCIKWIHSGLSFWYPCKELQGKLNWILGWGFHLDLWSIGIKCQQKEQEILIFPRLTQRASNLFSTLKPGKGKKTHLTFILSSSRAWGWARGQCSPSPHVLIFQNVFMINSDVTMGGFIIGIAWEHLLAKSLTGKIQARSSRHYPWVKLGAQVWGERHLFIMMLTVLFWNGDFITLHDLAGLPT